MSKEIASLKLIANWAPSAMQDGGFDRRGQVKRVPDDISAEDAARLYAASPRAFDVTFAKETEARDIEAPAHDRMKRKPTRRRSK